MTGQKLLSVDNLQVYYGDSHILHGITLSVGEQERVCVLGRNGVGKTTLLRGLMGLTPPREGTVIFAQEDITSLNPWEIARRGISYVPQGRRVFPRLSVEENLQLGSTASNGVMHNLDRVFYLFPVLKDRRRQQGGTLSGGEQQMLAIARGLIAGPRLMLLDEPSEGLQPSLLQDLTEALEGITDELGISVLLVEQNLDLAFSVAQRGYVMEKGQMVAEGAVDVLCDDTVVCEYLTL